ncbi:NlpC/P60 family protein [Curtobacterium sp. MCLR17_007]|uniref:C40 family peptidase n=1 Tax=Curtobacterium sp. MCLR17_007 TaxID=2175648 RepID=UPI0024DFEA81|nr:C40 family peptidase [Curtobacterium sp. MCLR17_007]WIB61423.1 NlpC/P60 family protein [Curtobacterium sp. MCLR17_007]
MGRHALPAAADDRRSAPAPSPSPSPAATPRSRGRRAASGPALARSSYVEHEQPARVVALHPVRSTAATTPPAGGQKAGAAKAGAATAGAAFLSRTGSLRAERALDPRHVRRAANAKRAALILAPALAFTSALTLSMPANAATPEPTAPRLSTTSEQLQTYTVAHDVEIPVTSTDSMTATTTTTVVSYPTLVTRFGVTTAQAESAISAALSAGGDRATVLETALQYLGDPYVEGGASHAGIDCSGLTMVAYQAVGIQLVHYVPTQDAAATTIPDSEAKPGDMVVYDNEDHVGLYLGDGLVLQAPHPGEVVDIVPMYSAAHHFARLLPAGS